MCAVFFVRDVLLQRSSCMCCMFLVHCGYMVFSSLLACSYFHSMCVCVCVCLLSPDTRRSCTRTGEQAPAVHVGNLSAIRDFLDVRDIARAYIAMLDVHECAPLVHVCSGEGISLQAALDGMLQLASVRVDVVQDPERMRPNDVPVIIGDCSLLKRLTGWERRESYESTWLSIMEWARSVASPK